MDKKYLSKLTIGGNQYDIKDAEARAEIVDIKSSITGAMHWAGYTTSALVDGSTTNPIVISGEDYTAKAGDVVAIAASQAGEADLEFVFSGTKWQEYGSTGSLKALAFKDSASGSVVCDGTNSASAVTFTGGTDADFVTGYNNDAVAPSFSEGAFTPASLANGFYSAGTAPSFTEGSFSQGTLPTFSEGAFTPASLGTGFYSAGTAASYSHSGFSGGSLGAATTGTFATEGVTASVTEATETLVLSSASTSSAVTAQGAFTAAVYGTDTFDGGTPTTLDLTKFDGGSKAADTFTQGTLPSKDADTFSAGTMTTLDLTKFDGGSKAADSFSAGSAATLATSKAITNIGTGTAAAQTFSGATVSVTVS